MAYSPRPDNNKRSSSVYSDRSSMSMQGHPTHDDDLVHSPHSPSTPEPHQPLLGGSPRSPFPLSQRQTSNSNPINNFVSSPLNPRVVASTSSSSSRSRGFDTPGPSVWNGAGSSIDYNLIPPTRRFSQFSVHSHSDASLMSYSEDSKYPHKGGAPRPLSGLIAYAYDPLTDHNAPDAEDELPLKARGCNWRGLINVSSLLLIVLAVVMLFTFYPIFHFFTTEQMSTLITGNVQVNASGQTPNL